MILLIFQYYLYDLYLWCPVYVYIHIQYVSVGIIYMKRCFLSDNSLFQYYLWMSSLQVVSKLLLPASEGWGGYCFHRCLSIPREYPSPRFFPRSQVPCPFWGYPSPGWGVPSSGPLGQERTGVPPGQDRTRVPPKLGQDGLHPGQDWSTPPPFIKVTKYSTGYSLIRLPPIVICMIGVLKIQKHVIFVNKRTRQLFTCYLSQGILKHQE